MTDLGNVLEHPYLRDVYKGDDDLSIIPLESHRDEVFSRSRMRGGYQPNPDEEYITLNFDMSPAESRETLLHEVQHAIQEREGFGGGASPSEYSEFAARPVDRVQYMQARKELADAREKLAAGETRIGIMGPGRYDFEIFEGEDAIRTKLSELDDFVKEAERIDAEETAPALYRRTSGEVEARNVTARRRMLPEQRRATPPWETQDVPDEQQIVRRR